MNNLLADLQIAPDGGFTGFGKLGLKGSTADQAAFTFTGFISSIIGIMTIIAIIWFVFLFISGAIGYMTSGGDKGAVEAARKKIVNGLTGLVIVFVSIMLIAFVGYLLGIPNLLELPDLLNKLVF